MTGMIRTVKAPVIALAAVVVGASGVWAQGASPAPPVAIKPVGAIHTGTKITVRELAARLSKETGVWVTADRTVSNALVSLDTLGGPLEKILPLVTAQLPKGSVVRTVLLPPFIPGASLPDGDTVVALSSAQDALIRPVNGAAPVSDNDVVVLGRVVKASELNSVMQSMNLRPVYVLTNPTSDPINRAGQLQAEMLRLLSSMTPEQQSAMADQQWDSFMNMDPAQRKAMLQQSMQIGLTMMQKMQSMAPEQRNALIKEIQGALPPNLVPPGGLPGGGNR